MAWLRIYIRHVIDLFVAAMLLAGHKSYAAPARLLLEHHQGRPILWIPPVPTVLCQISAVRRSFRGMGATRRCGSFLPVTICRIRGKPPHPHAQYRSGRGIQTIW